MSGLLSMVSFLVKLHSPHACMYRQGGSYANTVVLHQCLWANFIHSHTKCIHTLIKTAHSRVTLECQLSTIGLNMVESSLLGRGPAHIQGI